jgi:hypothetical protein
MHLYSGYLNKIKVLSILFYLIASPKFISAQSSIVTDRPDFVESSSTVGTGSVQVEGSFAFDHKETPYHNIDNQTTPFLLRIGVSNSWELRLGSDGIIRNQVSYYPKGCPPGVTCHAAVNKKTNGISDFAIGLKWAFLSQDESTIPAMAALIHVELPIGSEEFRGPAIRPSFRIAVEWGLANNWGIGVMPGLRFDQLDIPEGDGGDYTSGIFGTVISKGLTDNLRVFFEVAYEQITKKKNGGNIGVMDFGGTFLLNNKWQIDAAIAIGITDDAPDFGVTFGLSGLLFGNNDH